MTKLLLNKGSLGCILVLLLVFGNFSYSQEMKIYKYGKVEWSNGEVEKISHLFFDQDYLHYRIATKNRFEFENKMAPLSKVATIWIAKRSFTDKYAATLSTFLLTSVATIIDHSIVGRPSPMIFLPYVGIFIDVLRKPHPTKNNIKSWKVIYSNSNAHIEKSTYKFNYIKKQTT